MDLRGIANQVSDVVNPNIPVTVYLSAGYTVGEGRKQEPSYDAPISGFGQLQALDGEDLKQLQGLNLQGKVKALYLYGELAGVLRPDSKGGDLVVIGDDTWLTVRVLEGWGSWSKVAIQLQISEGHVKVFNNVFNDVFG